MCAKDKNKKQATSSHADGDQVQGDKRVIGHVGGSYVEGDIQVEGGDIVFGNREETTINVQTKEIFQSFYQLVDQNPKLPDEQKQEAKDELQQLESEAKKGDEAEPSFVQKRLNSLKAMSDDIYDVVVATLASPTAGVSTVVSKIAKKMATDAT